MKRLMLLASFLLCAVMFPLASYGQSVLRGLVEDDPNTPGEDSTPPQRIGVPKGQMQLSSNETGSTTGFCFDEYLIAPRRVKRFENVLAGNNDAVVRTADGHTMNLHDAVASGELGIRATQLQVMFTNKTKGDMQIEMRHPVVLWDRAGGDINPLALAVLEREEDYDSQQEAVWRITTAERLLGILGYYQGSPWTIDRDRFHASTAAYQQARGLAPSGTLDDATMASLATDGNTLQNQLRGLGFRDTEGRSLKEDLAAQVRAYERYMGRPVTGRWSEEMASRLATDQKIIPQVSGLRTDGKSVAEVLASGNNVENVVTYLTGLKGFMALVETPQGVELWGRRGSAVQFQGRDLQAIQKMDDAAAALAVRASHEDRIVLYPRVSKSGQATLQVGNQNVSVDARSLKAYLSGGDAPTELAGVLTPSVPGGSAETGRRQAVALIVYRGPFVQGRGGATGAPLAKFGLEQIDGAALAKALDRTYGDRSVVYVSDDLRAGATRLRDPHSEGSLVPRNAAHRDFALAR